MLKSTQLYYIIDLIIGQLDLFDLAFERIIMKDFFSRYSYQTVHLFLNQVAIGLFGMVLALAAGMAESDGLKIGTSIFAVIFFLFLQFASAWRVGSEDRVSVDLGKRKRDLLVPIKMWALANSLNFLLALFISLGLWFPGVGFFSVLGGIASPIKLVAEGMYTGLLSINVGGQPLNTLWFMHFLTPLPALLAIVVAYLCGLNNINFRGLFSQSTASK